MTPTDIAREMIKEIYEDFDDMATNENFKKLLNKLDISSLEKAIANARWEPRDFNETRWQELALLSVEDWLMMTDQLSQEHAEAICDALDNVWQEAEIVFFNQQQLEETES
jgi:hypothetical protein